jgi:mannose-6-phosphate isomerase-like protein (cupin superfamily)/CDGSH-type Zn-finger protein
MGTPTIAHRKGFHVEVKAGKRYFWCSCGRSANQPFCDGSHQGTEFSPVLFEATADEDVIFCGCKHTGTRPFCDGSHSNLPGATIPDDPDSPVNKAIKAAPHGANPNVPLDGACYVFSTARAKLTRRGTMNYCPVVTPTRGALFQSQFYAEIGPGVSPVIASDGSHTILFVAGGQGRVEICGRPFAIGAGSGVYVRPAEAFRLHNETAETISLFISTGPGIEEPGWLDEMPSNFDGAFPNRLASIDPSLRREMGERFFQLLVSREHGCTEMTQFIGRIPLSKAEPHRHLYEEVLIFLNGAGVVWTETTKTAVGPGDVLFLPRKLAHSVQCTSETGLDVVGVIYPGDNPAISC